MRCDPAAALSRLLAVRVSLAAGDAPAAAAAVAQLPQCADFRPGHLRAAFEEAFGQLAGSSTMGSKPGSVKPGLKTMAAPVDAAALQQPAVASAAADRAHAGCFGVACASLMAWQQQLLAPGACFDAVNLVPAPPLAQTSPQPIANTGTSVFAALAAATRRGGGHSSSTTGFDTPASRERSAAVDADSKLCHASGSSIVPAAAEAPLAAFRQWAAAAVSLSHYLQRDPTARVRGREMQQRVTEGLAAVMEAAAAAAGGGLAAATPSQASQMVR